jgi:hypothetical protein
MHKTAFTEEQLAQEPTPEGAPRGRPATKKGCLRSLDSEQNSETPWSGASRS